METRTESLAEPCESPAQQTAWASKARALSPVILGSALWVTSENDDKGRAS